VAEARETYRALLEQPLDDDQRRLLQVKLLACESEKPRERALIFELLVGEPGERADGATAVHLARELREQRSDGLPHYLEARRRFARTGAGAEPPNRGNSRGSATSGGRLTICDPRSDDCRPIVQDVWL
jgi:hypothetical protein